MSFISLDKNNFIAAFNLFSKTVKNNFARLCGIIAGYSVIFGLIYFTVMRNNDFLSGLLAVLLLLSFISVSAPLFAEKDLRISDMFPNWKFAGYSLIIICVVSIFLFPVKLFTRMLFNGILQLFIDYSMNGFVNVFFTILTLFSGFFVFFTVLDFNRKPKIDQPVINSAEILISNWLLVMAFTAVGTILIAFIPYLDAPRSFSFPAYMIICLFLTAVYYVVKPEDEEYIGADKKAEMEEVRLPKMKITT
ncbi:MAG: hypothetical protein FWG57_06150 [Endomicrobia bacterium]|nr:hypothetical protein [Endomicrobiia bacterium]